ncbi:MAG TPA: hypothetical protein VEA15_09745 [Caulobacteraceae bacterium]|nr:hypothetical protein [Caulobacteraceae bacterium]
MSDFEFYFSYYGLLLGFSVATVIGGLARALNERERARIGVLTPLLALFVLLDISSFWLSAWDERETLRIGWAVLFSGLAVAGTYYLSASLVFPNRDDHWPSLEDHYWARKRWVVGGLLAINLVLMVEAFMGRPPAWDDWLAWVWQLAYFAPLLALIFSRRRAVDLGLLIFLILFYLTIALGLLPESQWGQGSAL